MLKGSLIIGQSGGPSSVINASAYGVIRTALDADCITKVYGAYHGIKRRPRRPAARAWTKKIRAELDRCCPIPRLPRSAPAATRSPDRRCRRHRLQAASLRSSRNMMSVISAITAATTPWTPATRSTKLYEARSATSAAVIGVPKTIDNDLFGTDHCPGYASAAKYIATSAMEVARDSRVYNIGQITIIECMGRHAGWLTAAAALAQARRGRAPDSHLSAGAWTSTWTKFMRQVQPRAIKTDGQLHRARSPRASTTPTAASSPRPRPPRPTASATPSWAAWPRTLADVGQGNAPGREGSRHRAEPAAALRRALRVPDRHRRVLYVRQDRC